MDSLTQDLHSQAEKFKKEADKLRDEKRQLESDLQRLRNNLDAKEKEARDLQSARANTAENQVLSCLCS